MSGKEADPAKVLRPAPVSAAWALALGIDLFFNAGVFSPLFDRSREPVLLSDAELFRRIPVAYAALLLATVGLAWLIDRMSVTGWRNGALLGAGGGVILAATGVVSLWTAVDMSLEFVGAAVIVQVCEAVAVGAVLGACAATVDRTRIIRRTLIVAFGGAVLGIVVQNLL